MDYVFIDTETTGLNRWTSQIWEIAYAINRGPVYSSFVHHSLGMADPAALEIGRYHERLNEDTKYHWESFENLFKRNLAGNILVAANPGFDSSMLANRWKETPWHYRMIDIEVYAMPALGLSEPRGMAYIAEQLEVEAPDHTAANDVKALQECFYILQNVYRGQF